MKYGFTSFLQRSKDKGAVLFISYEEVITLTEEYFADFPKSYFLECILKLENRLTSVLCQKKVMLKKINPKKVFYIVFKDLLNYPRKS